MYNSEYRAILDINLDNLKYNLTQIANHSKSSAICAVVKANAYGHGALPISKYIEKNKLAAMFAVADLDEAISLRKGGIQSDILILGCTDIRRGALLQKYNLIQTVDSISYAQKLSGACSIVRCHIAVNTGMTRIGIDGLDLDSFKKEFEKIVNLFGLKIEGIYTHLSVADSSSLDDVEYTKKQIESITSIKKYVNNELNCNLSVHFLNSAGAAYYPDSNSDFCRVGISMYGLFPNSKLPLPYEIRPVLSIISKIVLIRSVSKGTYVGYGRTYKTEKEMKIGVVPYGYADGLSRMLSNNFHVLINGKRAPIIGRICMDQFMVDLSDNSAIVGDEVVIVGKQGQLEITLDSQAEKCNTIGYELACLVSRRVPRRYHNNDEEEIYYPEGED